MTRYAIIGNGVAGVRAAEAVLERDPAARVVAVTEEPHPFYLRPQLPAYVAGRVGEGAIRGRALDRLDRSRFELRLRTRVSGVDVERRALRLESGGELPWDRLVIATGAVPRRLGIANEDAHGVVRLKTLEDARRIRLLAQDARHAVVAGSGIFGVELLQGLLARGLKVTYMVPEERFWPEALDPTAGRLAEADLRSAGVDFHPGTRLAEIRVRGGRVVGVVTASGELVECDVVGIGLGYRPAVEFLAGSGIETDRGVLVDDLLRTSVEGVYAAGDAAQMRSPLPGTAGLAVRWQNAWQQGRVAGENAAGLEVPFPPVAETTSTRILGRDLAVLGEGHLPAGDGLVEAVGPYPREGVYKRLVAREGRLTGALLYGEVREAGELIPHVRERTPMEELPTGLARRLFDLEAETAPGRSVVCPACKLRLPLPPEAGEGDIVTCAACGIEMRLQRLGKRLAAVAV